MRALQIARAPKGNLDVQSQWLKFFLNLLLGYFSKSCMLSNQMKTFFTNIERASRFPTFIGHSIPDNFSKIDQ
jgi:hypothetical protein